VVHDFVHRRPAYSGLCGSCVRIISISYVESIGAYRSPPTSNLLKVKLLAVSCQNPFDLRVKFPRYFESIAVPIGSKIGGHPVIRDTHTIWTLLNEDGHRRIRASVHNMLHHFLHDQRIARNDAENSWLDGPILFLENLTVVEPRKLHKPVRLSH